MVFNPLILHQNKTRNSTEVTQILYRLRGLPKMPYQRKSKIFFENLDKVFDITRKSGRWLTTERIDFYSLQVMTDAQTSYSTRKDGSASIHLSKRIPVHSKHALKNDTLNSDKQDFDVTEPVESNITDNSSDESPSTNRNCK